MTKSKASQDSTQSGRSNPWFQAYSQQELALKQRADLFIAPILKWLAEDRSPFGTEICTAPETRNYWNYWDSLRMQDGLLFKGFHKDNGQTHIQFIVQKSIGEEIIKTMHASCISGHFGRRKTTKKILQRFYWYNLREDVNN